MELRKLSKLQIRAEVMMVLQNLSVSEDISKIDQTKYLKQLGSIENQDQVIEILARELEKADYTKKQIITFFLINLGTLEQLKDILWGYIKGADSSDELKDFSNIILRELGDNTEPETFLNYLDDPKAVVDRETLKLLEVASVNPEAAIDFLDFLFSLPENEQIDLINSFIEDYNYESLANVFIPIIETKPSQNLQEIIVKALGSIRNEASVPVLHNLIKYSNSEKITKLAQKSLNMLKLSGINIDNNQIKPTKNELSDISDMYQCYSSSIDGIGNQGLIISRKKTNEDILMFSVVINDLEGIIDCFGFYGITAEDFARIIERFEKETLKVRVSPEYCRTKLLEAEEVNRINDSKISYEYTTWKKLIEDVDILHESIENKALSWANKSLMSLGKELYNIPDLNHWFLEEDCSPQVNNFLENIMDEIIKNNKTFLQTPDALIKYIENQILLALPGIFCADFRKLLKKRMLNQAYLFNCEHLYEYRDIAASTALSFDDLNVTENTFLKQMLKKSIYEKLLRYQYDIEQNKQNIVTSWNIKKRKLADPVELQKSKSLEYENIESIIDILVEYWGNE